MLSLRETRSWGRADVPADPREFLTRLAGPTVMRVRGADRSRTRAVTTLLHGNEPSGFEALHAWLRSGREPAVDALLVFANVEAALAQPGFAHRMLPGRRDLNRCFHGPFTDPDGSLAGEILQLLQGARPEAVVDIHNNSGHNPPYGVGLEPTSEMLQVVSLFAARFVWSQLELGALMERLQQFPSATIEVGRSGDPGATAVALRGLERFLEEDLILRPGGPPEMRVYAAPMRVRIRSGARLAVADEPDERADVTIEADLDRHNFERVANGTAIGWIRDGEWPIELLDAEGIDRSGDYLSLEGDRIVARRDFVPIMITTDPDAAMGDCLFYVVDQIRTGGS